MKTLLMTAVAVSMAFTALPFTAQPAHASGDALMGSMYEVRCNADGSKDCADGCKIDQPCC